jgi:hypothetical protein
VNSLGPGQDGVGTIRGRCRDAERVVDRRVFLFGGRWECEERELGDSIDLEDDGRHGISRLGVAAAGVNPGIERYGNT